MFCQGFYKKDGSICTSKIKYGIYCHLHRKIFPTLKNASGLDYFTYLYRDVQHIVCSLLIKKEYGALLCTSKTIWERCKPLPYDYDKKIWPMRYMPSPEKFWIKACIPYCMNDIPVVRCHGITIEKLESMGYKNKIVIHKYETIDNKQAEGEDFGDEPVPIKIDKGTGKNIKNFVDMILVSIPLVKKKAPPLPKGYKKSTVKKEGTSTRKKRTKDPGLGWENTWAGQRE